MGVLFEEDSLGVFLLVTVFLGLELLSIALYIACGFVRTESRSQEAAAKYLLIGGFATEAPRAEAGRDLLTAGGTNRAADKLGAVPVDRVV